MELSEVYDDADAQGAVIYPYVIGFSPAATIELNNQYAIFVDFSMCSGIPDLAWKIGHEVSHCACGCLHRLYSKYDLIEQHEYRARRREIEKYIPKESIQRALDKGYREPWEIAEYLNVPEYAVRQAFEYWTEVRGVEFEMEE